MAIGPPAGAVIDLYREHVTANPSTYTGTPSDDFRQNAEIPQSPYNPTLARNAAYGTQATVRTWQERLREQENQV